MPGAGGSARVPTVEPLAEADGKPVAEAEDEGPAVGLGVAVGVGMGVGVGLGLAESLGVAPVAETGNATAPIPRLTVSAHVPTMTTVRNIRIRTG